MIKDLLNAIGSWELTLKSGTPADVIDSLDYFGHIAIVRGPVDVLSVGDGLLAQSRYIGILRERGRGTSPTIGGPGMDAWAGDEDEKGEVLESAVVLTNATFADALNAVRPSATPVGQIYSVGGTYTGTHQWVTPRSAMNTICAAFGAEWFIGGDGKLYAGTVSQLYRTSPNAIIVRRNAGADMDLTALGGTFDVSADVDDYSTRIVLVGQSTDAGTFATGSANAPSVPYFDLFGNAVKRTRMISESGTTQGSVAARAQLQLNRFNRTRQAFKVSAEKYDIQGNFNVGDYVWVYDPETGVLNGSNEVVFKGEILHPDAIRVGGVSYPVSDEHTVAFRRSNGTWIDLTKYVVWETGNNEITVGDLPQSLGGPASNPVLDRVDGASAPDTVAPAVPTSLQATSVAVADRTGTTTAVVSINWVAPAQNADGSVISDLSYYIVQYKQATSSAWDSTFSNTTTASFSALIDLDYNIRVAAVDKSNNFSVYTGTLTHHTAADNIAPPTPASPTVTNYLGQLRIAWSGLSSTAGTMPPDFNRVDVHVGSTSNFTPSTATLVDNLVTAGVSYATAPYGVVQYVKLIALDNSGNASSPTASVSGSTAQVVSADVFDGAVGTSKLADLAVTNAKINDLAVNDAKIGSVSVGKLTAGTITVDVLVGSGRITTSLTGARVELNTAGLMAYNTSNVRTVFIDDTTGNIDAVGTFRTTGTNGRTVILAASLLSASGKGQNQPGLIFPSTITGVTRFGQIYDDGRAVVIDSMATTGNNAQGIPQGGSSVGVNSAGFFVYAEGQTADMNTDSMRVSNDGYVRIGRADVAGRGVMSGGQNIWAVETAGGSGTTVSGDFDGNWNLGDKNTAAYAKVSGYKTAWSLGSADKRVYGNPDGTWGVGHISDQAVYSLGNDLILRGRAAGGNIGLYTFNSAYWVDVWGTQSNNAQMFVHGTFGALVKNFIIDHPTDDKRHLVHSSTESPYVGVEYWGDGVIGSDGTATVDLPAYFEALTLKERRGVFLTSKNGTDPVSASEPSANSFTVTGAPGQEFDWLVKAVRSDASFDVEPLKTELNTTKTPDHIASEDSLAGKTPVSIDQ